MPRKEIPMRLLVLALVTVISLALASSSGAVAPTRQVVTLTSRSPVPCPSGVVLAGVFDVVRDITTFYDQDGNPVSQLWVASFEGTITNPLTRASLPSKGVRIFHRDLVTGEFFTTGDNIVTKLPDGGVAIGGAGRLAFDAAGNLVEHDGPDTATERAQLCAALGA
jgi:hypothetical protein